MTIMEVKPNQTFDAQFEAVRQKSREKLRPADVRRLVKLAGKRLTDPQVLQIAGLITQPSASSSLVFELLGDLTLAPDTNSRLLQLRPTLADVASRWVTTPPPLVQDLPQAIEWLSLQLETSPGQPPVTADRARAVLLWLVAQHQNPDFFLQCLRQVGKLLGAHQKKFSKKSGPSKREPVSGFVMSKLAKSVLALGRGANPKLGRLAQITMVIETILMQVRERSAAADEALRKQTETEGTLTQQQRLNLEQKEAIQTLEQAKKNLETRVNGLTQEVERLGRAHQQAIDHTNAQVVEGKRAMLTDIRSKLDPKISDAKLYLDRPSPVASQALRLIEEIAEALKSKEVRS